jgi:hypothetical protein
MKRWTVHFGNSSSGPVGFVVRCHAKTAKGAVRTAVDLLLAVGDSHDMLPNVDATVYFGSRKALLADGEAEVRE